MGSLVPSDTPALRRKYFTELDDFPHCDARFASSERLSLQSDDERAETLHNLMYFYSEFCREYDITSWLAHGTSIGYYWGRKQLPWDDDIGLHFHAVLTDCRYAG